jgi:hypothetical protein
MAPLGALKRALDDHRVDFFGSRELRYRLRSCRIARWRAAVKGGEAVPEGREDRRRSAAEPRTGTPLRADRRRATLSAGRVCCGSGWFWVCLVVEWGRDTAGRSPVPSKWASACRRAGCRASLRAARGAWWGAATARRVQSLSRLRHLGGSHADPRTRALAVSDPAHPASLACSRQRIVPSRRP